jgi:hypothetical protein
MASQDVKPKGLASLEQPVQLCGIVGYMRRKLTETEKQRIRSEGLERERNAFPTLNIDVVVEDYTWANGEANVRVVHLSDKEKRP